MSGMIALKPQKKLKKIDNGGRSMTTALFLLRSAQIGLTMADLETLTVGMVLDMITELDRDNTEEKGGAVVRIANQSDFDKF